MARKFLPDDSFFIVDVRVKGAPGNKKVEVIVDGDHGIDVDTCSMISRKLSSELDEADILEGKFVLEVSSPGLDQPLGAVRQYLKNIGRNLKIVLNDRKMIKGELLKVDDQGVTIKKEAKKRNHSPETTYIQFDDIDKAKVIVTFK